MKFWYVKQIVDKDGFDNTKLNYNLSGGKIKFNKT